ncbi:glycoside hydrolase family 2 TIM barrel-domain containing protein [Lachnoclostridium sp. Marseille-P6806]|uniref:glycoside hydrolase family 2 TIM barrel-domain containing protein n=1 Tax=Lachnoclostridium sp. Marseille-P6806 TaxID=2364793 RepID=UPI0010307F8C|nr:glycoside hydrolase family 2 TIM barrel-domain containing protein [Lachnoclostridium sp. Marseille-P6806]
MIKQTFDFNIVRDPRVYKQNVLPAHSDHEALLPGEGEGKEGSFRYSLNGLWRFSYAPNPVSAIRGFEKDSFDCSGWDSIRVPAHMQMEGYDVPAYINVQYPWDGSEDIVPGQIPERFNPVGSYVRYFEVPESFGSGPVFISFQGVESGFALWLNGEYVGYSEDSFTPSEFDLTSYIRTGRNKLAVRVFKWTASSWLEDQDFYRFSGIFREVYLFTRPAADVYDLRIRALLDEHYRDGRLEVTLDYGNRPGKCAYTLRDAEGTVVAEGSTETRIALEVKEPFRWSAEEPYLYELTLAISDSGGAQTEVIREKVGFRRFEMKNGLMCINGKRIVFRGVNRHEFSCDRGRAVVREDVISDIITMKRNNINAVRTCHYPDASMIYRLCDEYGLYMIAESNMESHGSWDAMMRGRITEAEIVPGDRPEYMDMLLDRVNSCYQRDKNHPAIVIWSCGNESYGGTVISAMADFFREQDPDRLVHNEGIDHDPRHPEMSDMYSQMYTPVPKIEAFLREHTDRPLILCEYTHSMGNSNGAMHRYIELEEREPRYQGGFIWDFIDQAVRRRNRYGEEFQAYGGDCGERPTDYNFSGNGIVNSQRRPYAKMQEVKFNYQSICAEVENSSVRIINKNLFVGTDRFDCVATLERNGRVIRRAPLATHVPPLSEESYPLPFPVQTADGEYAVTVSFRLRESTPWAEAGYELAFGQGVYTVGTGAEEALAEVLRETPERESCYSGVQEAGDGGSLTVVNGVLNIGVRGENFSVLFGRNQNGIVSYRYGGRELIEFVPRPDFWRAPTDNDAGNRMAARYGVWKLASLYQGPVPAEYAGEFEKYLKYGDYPKLVQTDSYVDVAFRVFLESAPRSVAYITYRVTGDGAVRVSIDCEPAPGLPPMPSFGFQFRLNADYDRVTWYGLGPEENYCDRNHGARLGIFTRTAQENMEPYLVPQETGNRTGVRWAKVTDRRGRGMFFAGDSMEFSAIPYTPEQLEEAHHSYELPRVFHTVVRCAMMQMGIAGDDSWGARTHEEYLLPAGQALHFAFMFRGI